jgi:hypothetical protein
MSWSNSPLIGGHRKLGALLMLALAAIPWARAGEEPHPADCHGAVGTYVATVTDVEGVFSSRALLTFAPGGVFLITDSGQSRVAGTRELLQPIQGAWRCVAAEGDSLRLSATGLGFALPQDGRLRNFARVDYRGTIDRGSGTLSGTLELSLPEDEDLESADPVARPGPPIERFELDGKQVVSPAPSFG